MFTRVQPVSWSAALMLVLLPALHATTIPQLTFEQLTDTSELIASGRVTRTWTAWDSEHKYIWTHYQFSVTELAKGRGTSVDFAEPGGMLDGKVMSIAGAVQYGVGDSVVVFLSRMPNGYLRTTGWSQGKYSLDGAGQLHGSALAGLETLNLKTPAPGASLGTLEGMSLTELKQRVAARVAAGRVK